MKNDILLTGSSGFLGQILLKNLSLTNKVYSLGRKNSDCLCDLALEVPSFNFDFDTVIHAASLAHNKHYLRSILISDYNYNILLTKNLLDGLNLIKIKHFVFISSVSVYGLIKGNNIDENYPLLAKDQYGLSKIESEKMIQNWCNMNNIKFTILRLPLIVGPNPPGNLGSMIRGIKKGYYFNIDRGNANKSMILASDIAKFILLAAEIGGVYNLTDGIHPTFYELSKEISKILDKSFVPSLPTFAAKRLAKVGDILGEKFPINTNKLVKITSTLTFDDTKARMAFGWKPIPVLEGLNLEEYVK
jgi:nucleoside-diphosphate-sugar epimerase